MASKSPDHTSDLILEQYWFPVRKPHLLTCVPMSGRLPGFTDSLTPCLSVSQDQPRGLVAL